MHRTWLRLRGDGPYDKLINLEHVLHLEYRPATRRHDGTTAPASMCLSFAGSEDAGCIWVDGTAADAVAAALGLTDPPPPGPEAELVAVPPGAPAAEEPW